LYRRLLHSSRDTKNKNKGGVDIDDVNAKHEKINSKLTKTIVEKIKSENTKSKYKNVGEESQQQIVMISIHYRII
jgi:hypothetical protein